MLENEFLAAKATLDTRKLRDYSLATDNPRGSHKARVLFSVLGITAQDVEWLREAILDALPSAEAEFVKSDTYGSRYRADLSITRLGRQCMLRTAWIVAAENSSPRFVGCWVFDATQASKRAIKTEAAGCRRASRRCR